MLGVALILLSMILLVMATAAEVAAVLPLKAVQVVTEIQIVLALGIVMAEYIGRVFLKIILLVMVIPIAPAKG